MTHRIQLSSLPPTFRDAVVATRALSIRWIWIDSLCIVQDDSQDWEREAVLMGKVYQNAALTLAGASSKSCIEGLFKTVQTVRITETGRPGDQPIEVFARLYADKLSTEFPLLQRGWVLQETLLARRTVYFGRRELLWECRHAATKMSSPDPFAQHRFLDWTYPLESKFLPGMPITDVPYTWRKIATVSSSLALTFPRDLFPSLAGIAQIFGTLRSPRYYAGLWEDSLIIDLTWKTYSSENESYCGRRLVSWRAPTWSWGSVQDCQIHWETDITEAASHDLDVHATLVRFPGHSWASATVEDASLTLRGILVKGSTEDLEDPEMVGFFHPDSENLPFLNLIDLVSEPDAVYFARMVSRRGQRFVSLVLQCLDERLQVYERIGVISALLPESRGDYGYDSSSSGDSDKNEGSVAQRRPSILWWYGSRDVRAEERVFTLV